MKIMSMYKKSLLRFKQFIALPPNLPSGTSNMHFGNRNGFAFVIQDSKKRNSILGSDCARKLSENRIVCTTSLIKKFQYICILWIRIRFYSYVQFRQVCLRRFLLMACRTKRNDITNHSESRQKQFTQILHDNSF